MSIRRRSGPKWINGPVTRAQGVHGSGARNDYSMVQVKAAITLLRTSAVPLTIETIADQIGMAGKGRAVREMLGVYDGVLYQLGGDHNHGLIDCTFADEADAKIRRLESQAHKMLERAERCKRYSAEHLPRRQADLFSADEDVETDDLEETA